MTLSDLKSMSLASLLTSAQIRAQPVLLLGDRSLKTLYDFISGYASAHDHLTRGRRVKSPFPQDFHDWVAYRLGFYEGTSGWRRMITERYPDDGRALAQFFRLYDEYTSRKKRHVATIVDCSTQLHRITAAGRRRVRIPKRIMIITYADGPGCFAEPQVIAHYFPNIQSLADQYATTLRKMEVVDQKEFNRLCSLVPDE